MIKVRKIYILLLAFLAAFLLVGATSGVYADCGCGEGERCIWCYNGWNCLGGCEPKPNTCTPCSISCPGCACLCDGSCGDQSCDDEDNPPEPTATPAPWTVQGTKSVLSNFGDTSLINSEVVTVYKKDDPELRSNVTASPFAITNLTTVVTKGTTPPQSQSASILNNTYIATVSKPTNWDVFSTWCKNRTDCHTLSSPRTGDAIEMALGREGGYADLYWHFVPPPANLKSLCNEYGNEVNLSWTGPSDISSYPIRVDRLENPNVNLVCDENSNGPVNVCKEIAGTSTTISVDRWTNYTWWMHSGTYWDAVASKDFVCGPAPNAYVSIPNPNCRDTPGKYVLNAALEITGNAVSSTGLAESTLFVAKECGNDLCTYASGAPPFWCAQAGGTMKFNIDGGARGSFCILKTQTFPTNPRGWPQSYSTSWTPKETGVYYALINAISSNKDVYQCSGNPKCEYSDSILTKYPGTTCKNGRFSPCQHGSPHAGKVGNPMLNDLWGESVRFEVLPYTSCIFPTSTPTPTPVSCASNPLPGNTIVKSGTTNAAYQTVNLLTQRINLQSNKNYTLSIDSKNLRSLPTTYGGINLMARVVAYRTDSSGNVVSNTTNMALGKILYTLNGTKTHSANWNSGQYEYADITIYATISATNSNFMQLPKIGTPNIASKDLLHFIVDLFNYIMSGITSPVFAAAPKRIPTAASGISYRFQVSGASFICAPAPTSTTAPTSTPTMIPTVTPTVMPGIGVFGNIQQKTGSTIRNSTATFYMPFINKISVTNNTHWTIAPYTSTACATGDLDPATMYGNKESYSASYTFPPFTVNKGYCQPQEVIGAGFKLPVMATIHTVGMNSTFYELQPSYAVNVTTTTPTRLDLPIIYKGGAWIKLQDTSLTRPIETALTNNMPYILDKFNTSDTSELASAGMISGNGGFAPNNTVLEPLDKVSVNNWRLPAGYTFNTTDMILNIDHFVSLLLKTKGYNQVTAAGNITLSPGSINFIPQGSTVGQINVSGGTGAAVLIAANNAGVLGDISINADTSTGTLLVIANNINIGSGVTAINGIYVAKGTMNLGGGGNPLKIKGNVVTAGGVSNSRSRSDGDHARPSMFIQFDFDMYQKLMNVMGVVGSGS